MLSQPEFLQSLIDVSHIELQSYSFYEEQIICSSGAAQKILGYSPEEFKKLSRHFYKELVHPEDRELVVKNISDIIHSSPGQIIEMTVRLKKSDGGYLWVYTRKLVTETNEKGEPLTITTIAEDISNFILLQNKMKEKIAQLESISWKNSHLLRNPVASIIGLINMIEEENITSAHNLQIFKYMKQAIEKLDGIVHEINDTAHK